MGGGAGVDDGGASDEAPGGERGEAASRKATFDQEAAQPEATSSSQFADAFGARALTGACHPGEQRRRGERGDSCAQGGAGAVEQSPYGTVTDAQRSGHLFVAVPSEGSTEDDLALHVRESSHVGEGIAQSKTAGQVGFDSGGLSEGQVIQIDGEIRAIAGGVTGEVHGGVVGNAVEPRAQLAHLRATAQGRPGLQERLLDYVFGAAIGDGYAPAVAQERPAVALHERLKGAVVPSASHRGKPLIGLRGQQAGGCLGAHDYMNCPVLGYCPLLGYCPMLNAPCSGAGPSASARSKSRSEIGGRGRSPARRRRGMDEKARSSGISRRCFWSSHISRRK